MSNKTIRISYETYEQLKALAGETKTLTEVMASCVSQRYNQYKATLKRWSHRRGECRD